MRHIAGATVFALSLATSTFGQAADPAIFVANNGNAEGSVSSFHVNPDGSLAFVQKVVTPGSTNAQCIDISPNGRWLMTGHATANNVTEQLTFFEVHGNATMSIVLETTTPDVPIDVAWIDDEYFVVTNTSPNPEQVIVYRFDPSVPSITQVWFSVLGTQVFYLTVDRAHSLLYAQSSSSAVQPFRINADHTLTKLTAQPLPTSIFYLGPGLSPDGTKLYYGGGISTFGGLSSRWIGGFLIDPATGAMTPMNNSPYTSPPANGTSGPSPKQVVISGDGLYAFASHGTTAHIQGFSIDQKTGSLTPITGSFFDVGFQGSCGNMTVMNNLLFVTDRDTIDDGVRGVYSFTITPAGMLTQNGSLLDTQGSSPNDIAAWPGLVCSGDLNHSGNVDVNDLLAVVSTWGACPGCPPAQCAADIAPPGGNCVIDVNDLLQVISHWGPCPGR
jgi:6-phosphogluconolactonase (cycloisomerase 2 family)